MTNALVWRRARSFHTNKGKRRCSQYNWEQWVCQAWNEPSSTWRIVSYLSLNWSREWWSKYKIIHKRIADRHILLTGSQRYSWIWFSLELLFLCCYQHSWSLDCLGVLVLGCLEYPVSPPVNFYCCRPAQVHHLDISIKVDLRQPEILGALHSKKELSTILPFQHLPALWELLDLCNLPYLRFKPS